jgi:hypothetical protein
MYCPLENVYCTTRARPLDVWSPGISKTKSYTKPGVKMEVTVHIPDTIGARLGNDPEAIPRWLLEKAGLEAYRSGEISGYELRLMLGIRSRLELDAFLKMRGVYLEYTEEDFAHDAETSRQFKRLQAQSE